MADTKESDRPPEGDFHQQNLKAWQPLLTPFWVIVTFFFIGLVFVPIGIGIIAATDGVQEFGVRYDMNPRDASNWTTVTIDIEEDMHPPIYFYYRLTNFYQNHRRYVKSRFDDQLRGEPVTEDDIVSKCDPLPKWNDKLLYPCGLVANSYFTDTFDSPEVLANGSVVRNVSWDDSHIAWPSDVEAKFKPFPPLGNDTTNVGPQGVPLNHMAKDFIVWMRTAGLPNFKKLRYIIDDMSLLKGQQLRVNVHDVFDVKSFNGEKHIVVTTKSWLGGKNYFLGYAYVVVGALCLVLALAFLLKHKVSPRDLGRIHYFNWHASIGADTSNTQR